MIDPDRLCLRCMSELDAAGARCPQCGSLNAEVENLPFQLPAGSILSGEYFIGAALGQGGFGVTYIGWDINLDMKIAVKEYYPEGCVLREPSTHSSVTPLTGDKGAFFARGKEKFVEEARVLARFVGDPCIVNVRRFFQENGTAYIVMDFVDGVTLKQYAKERGGKLPAREVLQLMTPLMASLSRVHDAGLLHRDIAPDNIILQPNGTVKLIDFGAARQMSAEGEHSNTINVKHGFAPEEQYRTRGRQGAWTDVYALCATIYNLTTGVLPPQSMDRLVEGDTLRPPNECGADFTPLEQQALMRGLAVKADERTQDMRQLMQSFYAAPEQAQEQARPKEQTRPEDPDGKARTGERARGSKQKRGLLYVAASIIALAALLVVVALVLGGERLDEADALKTAMPRLTETAAQEETTASAAALAAWPSGLLAGESFHIICVDEAGGVVAAGSNTYGQCNISAWSGITAVAAGGNHTVGLRQDGTVVAAGSNKQGQCDVSAWTDIIAIAAGSYHTVGVYEDGTVVACGASTNGPCEVSSWTDIVTVAAGGYHTVGLRSDGTVAAAGFNADGQCEVQDWTQIVMLAASGGHTVGLRKDGSVVAAGSNGYGQCEVSSWRNIAAIAAGAEHTVGLQKDGTVVAAGANANGQCNVSDWKDIVAVACGSSFTVGLRADGRLVKAGELSADLSDWNYFQPKG